MTASVYTGPAMLEKAGRRVPPRAPNGTWPPPWEGAPWTPRRWQAAAFPAVPAALNHKQRAIVSAVAGSGKSVLIAELVQQRRRFLAFRQGMRPARPEAP